MREGALGSQYETRGATLGGRKSPCCHMQQGRGAFLLEECLTSRAVAVVARS